VLRRHPEAPLIVDMRPAPRSPGMVIDEVAMLVRVSGVLGRPAGAPCAPRARMSRICTGAARLEVRMALYQSR
jgi:hypothetical protein